LEPLSDKQKKDISDYLSFDTMKNNKSLQDFMNLHGKVYGPKYSQTGEDATLMRNGEVRFFGLLGRGWAVGGHCYLEGN